MKAEPTRYARPENLLEAMIAARDENNGALSGDELAANVLTMLLAGEDTTAHKLAWLIYFLSLHPGYYQQIRDEVGAVLGDSPYPTEHRQLEQLRFLEASLHEAMRLKPIAPIIVAEAVEDTNVGDVSLRRGTPILLLTRVGAVDARNFSEPGMFRPERWLGEPTEANHRKVSIPFGSGPRVCPGRYLALEEMKMLTAMLVANFDLLGVNTPNGREAQECLTFTMAPLNLSAVLKRRA